MSGIGLCSSRPVDLRRPFGTPSAQRARKLPRDDYPTPQVSRQVTNYTCHCNIVKEGNLPGTLRSRLDTHLDSIVWAITCSLPLCAVVVPTAAALLGFPLMTPLLLAASLLLACGAGIAILGYRLQRLENRLLQEAIVINAGESPDD